MAKSGGAAMLQLKSATSITEALSVMVDASAFSSADASRITAMVQTQQSDSDEDTGAPAAAVYEGKSGGIIGTLEGLTEKAEGQLDKARKEESTAVQNYQMLKQSLTDEMKFANKDMDKAKKGLSESTEKKANAEGGLEVTSKDLAEDTKSKSTLHQDCMSAAEEFEVSTKSPERNSPHWPQQRRSSRRPPVVPQASLMLSSLSCRCLLVPTLPTSKLSATSGTWHAR
jgi:hypothetical protein